MSLLNWSSRYPLWPNILLRFERNYNVPCDDQFSFRDGGRDCRIINKLNRNRELKLDVTEDSDAGISHMWDKVYTFLIEHIIEYLSKSLHFKERHQINPPKYSGVQLGLKLFSRRELIKHSFFQSSLSNRFRIVKNRIESRPLRFISVFICMICKLNSLVTYFCASYLWV